MNSDRLQRRVRALFLWAAAVLWAAGAGAAEVVIAVSEGPVSLPVYVAQSLGLFQREGLEVRVQPCASGRACVEMLRQQKADVATAAEFVVTLDGIRGGDAVMVATVSSSPHHMKLVARKDAGIGKPGDLRGKRVATVAGSSAEYFLDSWLLYHQIDGRDVRVIPKQPDALARALADAEADAVAIWEPAAGQAAAALGAQAIVLPNPRVYTQHFGLVTSRHGASVRTADLVRMLRALAKASRVIAEEPGRAKAIWRARAPAGSPDIQLSEHDFTLRLPQSLIATMEGQARWAARRGEGSATVRFVPGIEPSLLRQATPGAVELN